MSNLQFIDNFKITLTKMNSKTTTLIVKTLNKWREGLGGENILNCRKHGKMLKFGKINKKLTKNTPVIYNNLLKYNTESTLSLAQLEEGRAD